MKRLFTITVTTVALLAALALPVMAQTPNGPIADTNIVGTIGAGEFLGTVWNTVVGQGLTNLSATIYGTYTPSLKDWGYGLVVMRNLNLGGGFGAGVGVGIDRYQAEWYGLSAQATVNARTAPFAGWGGFWTNVIVTPLAGVALGTPFGSSSQGTSGNLETIAFTGAGVRLFKLFSGDVAVDAIYGTRTGLGGATGTFYGGGLTWLKSF